MAAQRCPLCHRAEEASAWRCSKCGYEFGQSVDRAIEIVRDALRTARIQLVGFILLDLVVLVVMTGILLGIALVGWIPILLFIVVMSWTVRAGQKVARLQASLRSLGAAKLPKATLKSG